MSTVGPIYYGKKNARFVFAWCGTQKSCAVSGTAPTSRGENIEIYLSSVIRSIYIIANDILYTRRDCLEYREIPKFILLGYRKIPEK